MNKPEPPKTLRKNKPIFPFILLGASLVAIAGLVTALIMLQNQQTISSEVEFGELPSNQKIFFRGKNIELQSLLTSDKNLLMFWAMWCGPCVDEIKNFSSLKPMIEKKAYNIIFINYDGLQQRPTAERFAKKFGIESTYDIPGEMLFQIGISTLPTSLVVDKKGKITKVIQGELNEASL